MRRDVRRRIGATQYNNERIRLNAIRKNQILPKELRVCRPIVQETINTDRPLDETSVTIYPNKMNVFVTLNPTLPD